MNAPPAAKPQKVTNMAQLYYLRFNRNLTHTYLNL